MPVMYDCCYLSQVIFHLYEYFIFISLSSIILSFTSKKIPFGIMSLTSVCRKKMHYLKLTYHFVQFLPFLIVSWYSIPSQNEIQFRRYVFQFVTNNVPECWKMKSLEREQYGGWHLQYPFVIQLWWRDGCLDELEETIINIYIW